MPIGKLPPSVNRKSSSIESPSMDSTIDSRMSSSELLPMELLKVNYVHKCKQAMMHKSNEPPPPPVTAHLNNPARFVGYRRQAPQAPNRAPKPMPVPALPLPLPTVESWLLLAKQPSTRTDDLDSCSCSDSNSNSDATETNTVTPDCEKSQSWNYRDIRRDMARTGAAAGIRSRADRIARIERKAEASECSECLHEPEPQRRLVSSSHRVPPKSRIPKPLVVPSSASASAPSPAPYSEANAQLQRRVKQLFQQQQQQQDVVYSQSAAPRWMFHKAGADNNSAGKVAPLVEQQSPRLLGQQRTKLERVHIRKKRQPLHIVNQLERGENSRIAIQDSKSCSSSSYKVQQQQQSPIMKQGDRMKRFSLESCCSDSGVSSSNDTKELQTKQSNLRDEKCISCVQLETHPSEKHKQYDRPSGNAPPKAHVDPNDVQNFAKKNVTKATTNELLTAAAAAKQCNIEKERKLNSLKHRTIDPRTSTTTISIDDSWVRESCIDPNDDYMETDSLILPSPPRPINRHNNNSVKIFVSSNGDDNGEVGSRNALSRPRALLAPSSSGSTSSSGCGGSSRDNSSLCESEQDCCSCLGIPSSGGNDCCNAIGGVFWNNACYDIEADVGAGCCCSISSCDDDDCSYFEGNFSAINLNHSQGRRGEMHLRDNKLLRKTGIHDLRPRSMDGVVDSGVSLNGDAGSSPDNGEQMQNQQDAEARKLKQGHVLSELLETERIYVNEMSSILKNTACNIVGRFNHKLGDSLIKRFNPDEPRESPLSFQGSLFDSQASGGRINYRPADFRSSFSTDFSGNYVFGTNLCNFATHNILNGKSTIKIINTLQECEEREASSETDRELEDYPTTVSNSLQRLKDQRRTIFKELIELSSCDESLEYRLVKDYLESNSYSEIENDTEFKEYLQRKNYMDILAYLEDSEPKSFMSVSSSLARAQSSLGSLNNTKMLSTPKSLKEPKQMPDLDTHMCSSCRSSLNILPQPRNERRTQRTETDVALTTSKTDSNATYDEILNFCHQFFDESFKGDFKDESKQLPRLGNTKFKSSKYERILKDFVLRQGYSSVEDYVEQKFGQFISRKINAFSQHETSHGYFDQMQSDELMHLVPPSLQGKEEILFGNLHELYTFHNEVFLKDLENCISTTELVALCFVQRRDTFYRLYSFYCQNIPRSDRLRETLVDTHLFLQECQKRLGHKLPLAAYLLKPVQRITKYQLLLKDLLRFSDSGSCTKELQKALDCMLIVLKCVNDSMHQVAITGFPTDLAQQGDLLLQDSFQVWTESKKDIRLRIKPQQRHIFLYQKSLLFCKQTSKAGHNKSTYQFKHHVKMSQIGLTESVRGDTKRFEVWLQGRQEVHTIQAPTLEVKQKWVSEIKRVLLNQLEELKGEKIKQYGLNHRGLKQTTSWDTPNIILGTPSRTINCDASSESSNRNSNCSSEENGPAAASVACGNSSSGMGDRDHPEGCGWSSDYSNSEDELSLNEDNSTPGSKFIALSDYTAMGHSEVSMREGEAIELLKVGCAGWWYVRVLGKSFTIPMQKVGPQERIWNR
ncbi:GH21435 [Drosophila grimshawi]|uniref:GH21435 n=1 Tax=Drosophila grimshawi TaxID=7222 RepID=B4J9F0_DROGR|nr:GH21435 [Drosophila grimshawi]